MIDDVDVLIVGAGPAGVSTALHLLDQEAGWRDRVRIVDKATFPRDKLCGGGITPPVDRLLAGLGLSIDVRRTRVDCACIRVADTAIDFRSAPAFTVIRRAEFDHWLLGQAIDRGVDVRQGEGFVDLRPDRDGMIVKTSRGSCRAKVVVGADGSNSSVRRRAGLPVGRRARLLEVLTPENAEAEPAFVRRRAVFDFGPLADGCQGYYWDFPCYDGNLPMMNRGIIDARVDRRRQRVALDALLGSELRKRNRSIGKNALRGSGIRWYQPLQPISREHVLLVGDAAGVDPLFGEGIPFALRYGRLASTAIANAFSTGDFRFHKFRWQVLRTGWGRNLLLRRSLAELSYRPRTQPLVLALWRLVARAMNNDCEIAPPVSAPMRSRLSGTDR